MTFVDGTELTPTPNKSVKQLEKKAFLLDLNKNLVETKHQIDDSMIRLAGRRMLNRLTVLQQKS